MTSPAGNVDFDRGRIGQGELIAGIAGFVLLIDLWFDWYGIKLSGGQGININVGASGNAWETFSLIDIILFLVALIAIGVAALRGLNRMPEMPYPPAMLVTGAGGLAVLLILFRLVDSPIDTHGLPNIDVSRKFGIYLGLIAAAGIAYGGWRAMQESGASFSSLGAAGSGGAAAPTGTTTAMPAEPEPPAPPPPAGSDPVPGTTGPETPPGLVGEPKEGERTTPPGL